MGDFLSWLAWFFELTDNCSHKQAQQSQRRISVLDVSDRWPSSRPVEEAETQSHQEQKEVPKVSARHAAQVVAD
jgi:hypothetical protein